MNITVINTGGTFNKAYNTVTGHLDIKSDNSSLDTIIHHCHNIEFDIHNIISKDSLDMNNIDRHLILQTIKEAKNNHIIVIHGTDTMNETASFLQGHCEDKTVVITGAMMPMSMNEIEATINFSQAIGFLNVKVPTGVYISMHGLVVEHQNIVKNKEIGKFLRTNQNS